MVKSVTSRITLCVSLAFRQYVHSPRPSAGLYVEEEQEVLETAEKSDKFCPFTWITKGSKDKNAGEKLSCSSEVLNRFG